MSPSLSAPPPSWLLPCMHILLGVSVVYRSRPLSLLAITFAVYWIAKYMIWRPAGNFQPLFQFGTHFFGLAGRTLNGLLIQSPHDFTPSSADGETHVSSEGERERGTSSSTLRRLFRTFDIGFATRGVGWRYRVKNVPDAEPSDYPPRTFISENLVSCCWRLIVVDVWQYYLLSTPMGNPDLFHDIKNQNLFLRLIRSAFMFLTARFVMDMSYQLASALSVWLGLYSPADWPPLMGRKRDMYTVRRFWSQMMRTTAEPPVHALARVLRIPKGSYMSNYFKVFGAFFVAYALHGYGTHVGGGGQRADWNFFMSQAVAIWIEETVVRLVQRSGLTVRPSLAKSVGYVWTALFMATSTMFWFERWATYGAFTEPALGFSIVGSLIR